MLFSQALAPCSDLRTKSDQFLYPQSKVELFAAAETLHDPLNTRAELLRVHQNCSPIKSDSKRYLFSLHIFSDAPPPHLLFFALHTCFYYYLKKEAGNLLKNRCPSIFQQIQAGKLAPIPYENLSPQ